MQNYIQPGAIVGIIAPAGGATTGNTLIGVALKDAASGDDTVQVRLNGSFG